MAFLEAETLIRNRETFVRAVFSGRRANMNPTAERVDIRPVVIKSKTLLQCVTNDGRQATTRNIDFADLALKEFLDSGFANITVESKSGSISIRVTKKEKVLVSYQSKPFLQDLQHDREKERLLNPSDPFLQEVGIADEKGQIKPSRRDKYIQVEEFLRLLIPTLKSAISAGQIAQPTKATPLSIVDLGCGNAYLTFAAHQYLSSVGIPVHVTGIDIRPQSFIRNNAIASNLGITSTMEFRAEEISHSAIERIDIAIALHACDTATDDAIAWGVKNGAKLLLIAPCCHHDLQGQMKSSPEPWGLLTKHGLLKERLGDLLTDALRAQILKILGYRTEAIEFIGGDHTPRNLMIRAVQTNAMPDLVDIERYKELVSLWKIEPALAKRLADNLSMAEESAIR